MQLQHPAFEFQEDDETDKPEDGLVVEDFALEMKNLKLEQQRNEKSKELKPQTDTQKKPFVSLMLKMKFAVVCKLFQKISQVRGKKKNELTQTFFENYALKDDRSHQYTYTLLRLILPFYDRERGVYKLQEKAIAKLFHLALGLPESEYQRMANYKHASLQPYGAPVGDFPSVVHSVIQGFCPQQASMTIMEIDQLLDELVKNQDSKAQVAVITRFIQRCTAEEIIWLVRIILKDLKIGLKHDKVLEYFHPDAVDYYNATSSLREVCKEFEDRQHSLKNVLRLFHPIKPMLAAKRTPDDIKQFCDGREFLIETKYDGERIQCHFTQEQMRYFTRNANDYTHIYGQKMTDIIRQCVQAQSAILDGEIVVVDKVTGEQVQFGLNKPIAREGAEEEGEYRLCYKVFDLLYVKGFLGEECNMMNLKLDHRRKVLKRIIKPIPMHLELVETQETNNFDDIINAFDRAVQRNEEGIIIKALDSEYHPNERSTKWVKMKGDYLEGLTDTFDVLILGGYYGSESHRTVQGDNLDRVTHFLLGISQKIDKQNPLNSIIYPFCKVGTGYTVVELSTIRNKLRPHFVIREAKYKPQYVPNNWNPGVQDRPDVYLDSPANSLILELKAAELIKSNTFPTDYTLRFPRCSKVRWDKDWHEVMTLQDLSNMINQTQYTKNLQKKNPQVESGGSQSDDEIADHQPQKITKNRKNQRPGRRAVDGGAVQVMKDFLGVDTTNIQQESKLFLGCEFYIANIKSNTYDKHYLEQVIAMHAGTTVQNFIADSVTHLIASIVDFRIDVILENKFPIIVLTPQWIIECIRRGRIVNFAPRFILYAQDWVHKQNLEYYDQYGDSYYEDVDDVALKEIIDGMETESPERHPELHALQQKYQQKYFSQFTSQTMLAGKRFFIWSNLAVHDEFEVRFLKAKIEGRGGTIVNLLTMPFDYIVLLPDNTFLDNKQIEYYLDAHPNTKTTTLENLQKILDKS